MRYRFIDEIVFDAADEALSGPSGRRRVPPSLVLELMAMTGGRRLVEHFTGRRLPLLLRVSECRFDGPARPGTRLRATADIRGVSAVSEDVAVAEASTAVFAEGERIATGTLMYVCAAVPGIDLDAWRARA